MREGIASVCIEANIPFDCRASKKTGGQRDDNKKWMKASAVNVLLEKMPTLIWKLCDVRYLQNDGEPEPLPEEPELPAAPEAAAPAAAPAAAAPAATATPAPGMAASAPHPQPPSRSAPAQQSTAAQPGAPPRRAPARPQPAAAAPIRRAPARPQPAASAAPRGGAQPAASRAGSPRSARRVASVSCAHLCLRMYVRRRTRICSPFSPAAVRKRQEGAEGRQSRGQVRAGLPTHQLGARQPSSLRGPGPRDKGLCAQALSALGAEGQLDLQVVVPSHQYEWPPCRGLACAQRQEQRGSRAG